MARLNLIKYQAAWADFNWTGGLGVVPAIPTGQLAQSGMVSTPTEPLTGAFYPAAKIYIKMEMGTAPNAGSIYNVYGVYGDGDGNRDDELGAGPVAPSLPSVLRVINAQPLGEIAVENVGSTQGYGTFFDTAQHGPLVNEIGIVIKNGTGQTNTSAGSKARYRFYAPQSQNEV